MQLNIAAEHVIKIADIMEEYILDEVKQNSGDFNVVNSLCTFYRKLKEAAASVNDNEEYVILIADEMVKKVVPDTIEKHIKDIVKDADNLDLISEITAIYNCLKNDIPMSNSTKGTGKKENYKKNNKSDDNRSSKMDVKDAQYTGENTQSSSEKGGQTSASSSKQQSTGKTGTSGGTNINAGNVENPQWAYDEEQLY